MLPDNKQTKLGQLNFSIYTFHKEGDELPMHTHDAITKHITICNAGSIKAYGEGWEKILKPGNITAFAAGQPHAFLALEDNSKVTNIIY